VKSQMQVSIWFIHGEISGAKAPPFVLDFKNHPRHGFEPSLIGDPLAPMPQGASI